MVRLAVLRVGAPTPPPTPTHATGLGIGTTPAACCPPATPHPSVPPCSLSGLPATPREFLRRTSRCDGWILEERWEEGSVAIDDRGVGTWEESEGRTAGAAVGVKANVNVQGAAVSSLVTNPQPQGKAASRTLKVQPRGRTLELTERLGDLFIF
ncbi:hypothetical protein H0H92_004529 [Tricholoma furcatifolium]|nr:hypothetical protein H0H92_004529 [Tricholoma furcatifolium]